jgi:LPS O-antigen subunit length determinant protein (WzzB/FepE family)
MSADFIPLKTIKHLFRNWWKIVLIAYLFALVGLVASYLLPAKYQAEAVFSSSIDFTQINFENLAMEDNQALVFTRYDEDLAVQVVARYLTKEMQSAYQYALTLDPSLTETKFGRDMQIERANAKWYLRYRSANPEIAQKVVNYWANLAFDSLKEAQAKGEAETFVIVDLVREAPLPEKPLYQNRGTLVLAGTLIGIITGVLVVDGRLRFDERRPQEA